MPVNVTYPGVYIDEVKSPVRTITGVPTSVAAFVGYAPRGPVDGPVHITGWADYSAIFGGLQRNCPMSYAVYQFYLNGGSEAEIVRVVREDKDHKDTVRLPLSASDAAATKTAPQPSPSPATTPGEEGGDAGGDAGAPDAAGEAKKKTQPAQGSGAAKKSTASVSSGPTAASGPALLAASPGQWALNLRARVDYDTSEPRETKDSDRKLFNLTVHDTGTGATERYLNVSVEPGSPRSLEQLLRSSQLVRAVPDSPLTKVPKPSQDPKEGEDPYTYEPTDPKEPQPPFSYAPPGSDSDQGATDERPTDLALYRGDPAAKTGLYQLLKTDIFNILCLPDSDWLGESLPSDGIADLRSAALKLCVDRRSILLVDPPRSWTGGPAGGDSNAAVLGTVLDNVSELELGDPGKNAAVYYPRLLSPDPLLDGALRPFPPCGVMAGVLARTDVQRGVWKAPAGTDASLSGVSELEVPLTDLEIGRLNPVGVNCLRRLPAAGPVAWGARTLNGADRLASEWKYLPVRRLALFIEESLFRGTQWVVFEPNDEPLWASIRLNVGAFMNSLFRAGAFQGRTPQDAYLVKCDKDTNPQNDIDRGIVNIQVGFAPLKPAEFVIVHIQQLAGQIQV
ncbi:phage tail sheath C-terminal domain-containing protein [Streptomyces sp. NPDC048057]|uniref:phage tail sheath family protein n=1 Tax=Streptomyces sp. NPDC048057 TaxID=3155628 RepID=UPI0033C11D86